jgi:hypothetical protein
MAGESFSQDARGFDTRGSLWRRWDPHIHAPGTLLNDQYGSAQPWEEWLHRIEKSEPKIEALGVTDYCSTRGYRIALQHKNAGRLGNVGLIFANIEFRLTIQTERGAGINLHLLFAPDDQGHLADIDQFLSRLTFSSNGREYSCTESQLIALGKSLDSNAQTDDAALRVGANQFKLTFQQLVHEWKLNSWVQAHGLIAISGGSSDGSAGLARDASFKAQREEIERVANLIFSGSPSQRQFWLGYGTLDGVSVRRKFGALKPCLHGSDAHSQSKVGQPDFDRFCWLKGDLTFETLRQVCLEPEHRVHVGPTIPQAALPSKTIDQVIVDGAGTWFSPSPVSLNPGLTAIIGARGSGKTALADLIACGAYSISTQLSEKSFIHRARKGTDHLAGCSISLEWQEGEATGNKPTAAEFEDIFDEPRVQYLSQQFVDRLCSSEDLAEELRREIERVVYSSHSQVERMGATDFSDLLDIRASSARRARAREEELLAELAQRIDAERACGASKEGLIKTFNASAATIKQDTKDRDALVAKGQSDRVKTLQSVSSALAARRLAVEGQQKRTRALEGILEEVHDWEQRKFGNVLATMQRSFGDAELSDQQWAHLRLAFSGPAKTTIEDAIRDARTQLNVISGPTAGEPRYDSSNPSESSLIDQGLDIQVQTVSLLEAEALRLQQLVGIGDANAKKHQMLSAKIERAEAAQRRLSKEISQATSAPERISELRSQRQATYVRLFDAICEEEKQLRELYAPLLRGLNTSLALSRRYDSQCVVALTWSHGLRRERIC